MFERQQSKDGAIRSIKFQVMHENENNDQGGAHDIENQISLSSCEQDNDTNLRCRNITKFKFSAKHLSCSAVILENICFNVNKCQQQPNFLKECIYRLKSGVKPIVRLVCRSQSVNEEQVQILKSINLNVPVGSIFGLLGPSSCGKTTLLRCLVGLLQPSSGSIKLFGRDTLTCDADDKRSSCCAISSWSAPRAHRSNKCKVPGSNVGYMPQDLGLYEDFTIEQLLSTFGRYMRMDSDLIKVRIKFMADFLELPNVDRQIHTLSGGQKRRVSFAIACLHMPPLIILDEPTVGVDPILRQSIWKYLRRLACEENKTIIITTHYIEEAAQADQVALMRAGEILIQDTPLNIMKSHQSKTLEEAFLKICNHVQDNEASVKKLDEKFNLISQSHHFNWTGDNNSNHHVLNNQQASPSNKSINSNMIEEESVMSQLKRQAQEKLALYDELRCFHEQQQQQQLKNSQLQSEINKRSRNQFNSTSKQIGLHQSDRLSVIPNGANMVDESSKQTCDYKHQLDGTYSYACKLKKNNRFKRSKLVLNSQSKPNSTRHQDQLFNTFQHHNSKVAADKTSETLRCQIIKYWIVFCALIYKNYRRNANSLPLLAFQFMLPIIQMISFSLCVGGKPTNIGLGIVNHENNINFARNELNTNLGSTNISLTPNGLDTINYNESLSLRYLSFIDESVLAMKAYDSLSEALTDVRRAKLWAVLEIGENFTASIEKRFDLDNFYQLESDTIQQSVIKLYPDRSNKILDMICHRSLVDSYRKFLLNEFEHFKRLPIEIAKPIFDIKPNIISNSIDGYTESIAPGLLASLTYIMAAGLTTFIMVVERSAGILERTYTSGIGPVSYLLAHAMFRSLVMMLQIGLVLVLTFQILQQPLVGSIWLAYCMLMVLNMTGISYGLLISSIVTDQNGAALTIVSSLVVKITLSGILWPFEAIPVWLRTICYMQPLTMPVQALKAITLKGASLGDRTVNLGFIVSLTWLLIFLLISTKRFKFYQH